MWKFALRRFLLTIPQIIILSFLIFILADLMPGDALTGLIDPNISPDVIAAQREALGLNNPWYERYWEWITNIVLHGDFGQSFRFRMPAIDIIGQRVGNTLRLSTLTLILTYVIAIPLGIISGRHHDTWKDRVITTYTFLGFGVPVFIFALLMLFLFGFHLNLFPTGGSVAPGMSPADGLAYHLSRIRHMILPALSVAVISTMGPIQYLRGEIVDAQQKEYVAAVRAKGADERRVYNKHILRNSLLPIASFLGIQIAFLIGGAVFIETIFSYPGMGDLVVQSILNRDFTVMTALTLLFGVTMIFGAFLSDILLMIVDPRVEIE